MNIAAKSSFVLSQRHLLGIEGLSYADIVGLLDLAGEFVELNRQIETKFLTQALPVRPGVAAINICACVVAEHPNHH